MKKILIIITKIYSHLYWWAKIKRYNKFGNNHIFNINIDNFKYKLTFGSHTITANIVQRIEGRREPETQAIYKSIIMPGMNVLEIGACFGEFTVLIDNLVGKKGRLLSIEGTPNIFKILEQNKKINNLQNTKIYNLFVTNSDKDIIFGTKDMHPYAAIDRIKSNDNPINHNETVIQKNVKVSNFLKELKFEPDVIVMDIEGFEVDVIEDLFLKNDLEKKPIILFENHPQYYNKDKNLEYLINILNKRNYRCIQINSNSLCYQK